MPLLVCDEKRKTTEEEKEVLRTLENLRCDLDVTQKNLDTVTDETLIDSYIYELKAVQMKYAYYIKLCKEKGLALG